MAGHHDREAGQGWMLISISHRFIFIATLKTASSSIESALQEFCEIRITQSRFGKHAKLGEVERRFTSVFDLVPRGDFRVIGVVRDPVSWMSSLYRSHKAEAFAGTSLYTGDMSFETFLERWCATHADQCVPQYTYFNDMAGRFAADYIIRYDHLEDDLAEACEVLDVPRRVLPFENVSEIPFAVEDVTEQMGAALHDRYADDALLAITWGGRWLEDKHRFTFGRAESGVDHAVHEAEARQRQAIARRFVSREDVVWAYRMLLNREPESEAVIEEHRVFQSREALRAHIMRSLEFSNLVRSQ